VTILASVKTIPLGRRRITKSSDRYYIILPAELNELWEYLHENGLTVNVLLEVNEEGSRRQAPQGQ
jgi:hypothetical protein